MSLFVFTILSHIHYLPFARSLGPFCQGSVDTVWFPPSPPPPKLKLLTIFLTFWNFLHPAFQDIGSLGFPQDFVFSPFFFIISCFCGLHLWPWPVCLFGRELYSRVLVRHLCFVSLRHLKPHMSELTSFLCSVSVSNQILLILPFLCILHLIYHLLSICTITSPSSLDSYLLFFGDKSGSYGPFSYSIFLCTISNMQIWINHFLDPDVSWHPFVYLFKFKIFTIVLIGSA